MWIIQPGFGGRYERVFNSKMMENCRWGNIQSLSELIEGNFSISIPSHDSHGDTQDGFTCS
jgi:hypothetical protein